VNDKASARNVLNEINKKIQHRTGVEENEVIIKSDHRVVIIIGAFVVLLLGAYAVIKFLMPADNPTVTQLEQNNQDNSTLLINQENIVQKTDSLKTNDTNKLSVALTEETATNLASGATQQPLTNDNETQSKIIQGPRKFPQFPGGETKAIEFINTNKKYPDEAKQHNIHGIVKVAFTLDENGKVIKTRIVNKIGYGCDEEAAKLFISMPNWIPANDGTKNLGGEYNWDIHF
jgi:TonB family protein